MDNLQLGSHFQNHTEESDIYVNHRKRSDRGGKNFKEILQKERM